jgi:uncharacterized Zn finger protein
MAENISNITEADIKQLSNEQSFSRGKSYYRGGAILEPVRQGNELRAYCEGSEYQPYRVSATLGPNGIAGAHCTCPYDWGGLCKHTIALLLAWVHEPESFNKISPTEELLANRSKEELIVLIKEMLKREPDLARLLELPVQPDRQTPLDLEAFRKQISYALRQHDYYDYPNAGATATELAALVDTADRFREGGDWANAGALYALVLNEVTPRYAELYDEDGDVAIELQRCAEGLDNCFAEGEPDAATRQNWLEALLEAHLKDIDMGGMDLAAPAGELVLGHATDEEWLWIEARVQQAIAAQTNRYSDWAQQALVSFLAARLEATGQTAKTDELIFELGSPRQQAFLLVERGRFAEAITLAQEHFTDLPGLATQFADALVEAGAAEAATTYMTGLLDSRYRQTYLSWLAKHAEKTGDLSSALALWRQSLQQSPSFETYKTLKNIAQQLNQWDETRRELLAVLETNKVWHILIDVALEEGYVARALELLPRLQGWHSRDYALRVAQAAENDHPQAALEIYNRRAQQLINARGRDSYREAARLLTRVQKIYKHQNNQAAWQEYITGVRQEHRNLPALQDELTKAGL